MGDLKILFSADQIHTRIVTLAREIDAAYSTEVVVHIIGVLRGGMMFTADLVRALTHATTIDFTHLESYAASKRSSGPVIWHLKPNNVTERHVLIVEDIVDTGLTLNALREHLLQQDPASLSTVCLLSKPARRNHDVPVEFVGFSISDRFVVGYGLDLDQRHRDLPYLAYLDEEHKKPAGTTTIDYV